MTGIDLGLFILLSIIGTVGVVVGKWVYELIKVDLDL